MRWLWARRRARSCSLQVFARRICSLFHIPASRKWCHAAAAPTVHREPAKVRPPSRLLPVHLGLLSPLLGASPARARRRNSRRRSRRADGALALRPVSGRQGRRRRRLADRPLGLRPVNRCCRRGRRAHRALVLGPVSHRSRRRLALLFHVPSPAAAPRSSVPGVWGGVGVVSRLGPAPARSSCGSLPPPRPSCSGPGPRRRRRCWHKVWRHREAGGRGQGASSASIDLLIVQHEAPATNRIYSSGRRGVVNSLSDVLGRARACKGKPAQASYVLWSEDEARSGGADCVHHG
eukprot:COSAG04_NODE_64_length_29689_cov_158.096992_1_plen_291_part_10